MAGIADILNFFSRKPEPSAAGAGRGEVNPPAQAGKRLFDPKEDDLDRGKEHDQLL